MDQHKSATRPHKYTDRSPELLLRMFNAYPILESVLSCSHRPDIVNLARTCRTLHLTFTTAVVKLRKAFPSCDTTSLKPCFLCNIPVCERCGVDTRQQETPDETMVRTKNEYALLGRRTPDLMELLTRAAPLGVSRITHVIKRFCFCELCFQKPEATMGKPVQNDWALEPTSSEIQLRILRFPTLWLGNAPNADDPCKCAMFDTVCEVPLHYVKVESLPINCELGALARGCLRDLRVMPFYMMD
ncbi:hypothetical protein L211DRAFT_853525 [Terfezia boudieri ATCC MYA-4762]|uniref:Uncharacterized protein n=1 Tax=Terfezia boudieri ATCC MYA-4762 TaxID=1051890 RepID=A0A3N4L830_9PEZI|nr:hypothetical protein L211DRAFT_853525 [Terfezia boudieri ATCC MYA-4762]